jgi:hypothetical protein
MGNDWQLRKEFRDLFDFFYPVFASKIFGYALRPPAVGIELFHDLLRPMKRLDDTLELDPDHPFRFKTDQSAEDWAIRALPVVVQPPRTQPDDQNVALKIVTAATFDEMEFTSGEMAASTMISPHLLASMDVMMWAAIRGGHMGRIEDLETLEASRAAWWSEDSQSERLDKFILKHFGKHKD